MTSQLAYIVASDLGVAATYRHVRKEVSSGEPLEPSGSVLKWYGIHAAGRAIPEALTRLAREYLMTTPLEARGLGFVMLHRCGEDFYFLIVCTWRGENELWETVFYKDRDMTAFGPWPRDGQHKPTLCVWELVPVWHEQQAWVDFLSSARDEAAATVWLGKRFAGTA